MTWTYDPTNAGTDSAAERLDAVRLLVGDTDTNEQQVQDEEIEFALIQSKDNIYYAASLVARVLASKYSRRVNIDLDGQLREDYSDLSKHYYRLADDLEYQGKKISGGMGMIAGGINRTEVEANRENTNRVQPSFRRDQFDNPPDGSSNYYYDYSN